MKPLLKIVLIFFLNTGWSCNQKPNKIDTLNTKNTIVKTTTLERLEPPNWWIGFKNSKLQLLVKHPHISEYTPEISHLGVTITKVHKAHSPNYVFIDLSIDATTKPGKFNITFKKKSHHDLVETYTLKAREKAAVDYKGFNSADAVYLISPDRFANGDPKNDTFENLNEKTINRNDNYARHGGDIKGITNHLDYIEDLGFTAIWPCPLLTNDMFSGSYHGYAITNFYEIDPRFGNLNNYKVLAKKMSEKGMKLIMDQVANHCGLEHWWMKDLPFKDWVNYQNHYENNINSWNAETTITSNHRRTSNQDIYASQKDKTQMTDGWFVSDMPDLNQRNPFLAKYLIQNSIWWIETVGLGGIRQDTYPYSDKDFMSTWAGTIMHEYPNFSIVGEEWSYNPLLVGYWQDATKNHDGYDSNLKSTMDFPMQRAIVESLNEEESWNKGLVKMYEGLANDFHYTTPKDIMIFPDNHDMSRIFTQLKGDISNTKTALSYILTLPRIPQIYYGTEILMDDFENPGDHGLVRTDFPGGWKDDTVNAFTGNGLTDDQKSMQLYVKTLLNFRKTSKAIHVGKTIHFAPENGVYVLFRIHESETIVHIINTNKKPIDLDLTRFKEVGLQAKSLKNVISGEILLWNTSLRLETKGSILLTSKI